MVGQAQGPARRQRAAAIQPGLGPGCCPGAATVPCVSSRGRPARRPVLQTSRAPPGRIPQKWSPVLVSSSLWAWGLFCKEPLASAMDKVNLLVFFSLSKSVCCCVSLSLRCGSQGHHWWAPPPQEHWGPHTRALQGSYSWPPETAQGSLGLGALPDCWAGMSRALGQGLDPGTLGLNSLTQPPRHVCPSPTFLGLWPCTCSLSNTDRLFSSLCTHHSDRHLPG